MMCIEHGWPELAKDLSNCIGCDWIRKWSGVTFELSRASVHSGVMYLSENRLRNNHDDNILHHFLTVHWHRPGLLLKNIHDTSSSIHLGTMSTTISGSQTPLPSHPSVNHVNHLPGYPLQYNYRSYQVFFFLGLSLKKKFFFRLTGSEKSAQAKVF